MQKDTSNNSQKQVERDEHGRLKKGSKLNPNGKPKGAKDYSTLYREALLIIAKDKGKTEDEIEFDLIKSGILRGIKGNYSFYRDVLDRVYGRPQEKVDLTSDGEPITGINYIIPDGRDNPKTNS